MKKDRFIYLAELLNEIMGEQIHSHYKDFKMPEDIIINTANILRSDFIEGKIHEDETGQLYYPGMIEDYGGLFDNFYQLNIMEEYKLNNESPIAIYYLFR